MVLLQASHLARNSLLKFPDDMRSSFEYFLYSNAVLVVAVIAGVSIALYCSCSFLWRKNFASRKKSKNRYRKPGKSAKQAKYRQLKNKFSSEEESVIEGEKSASQIQQMSHSSMSYRLEAV